jgi:hypothetical protein
MQKVSLFFSLFPSILKNSLHFYYFFFLFLFFKNSFLNELDPKYFGDTPIEGVKLFRRGRKEEPVTYRGKGDLLDIVAFVSRQRG